MKVKPVEIVFSQKVDGAVDEQTAPVRFLYDFAEQALGTLAAHAHHHAQPWHAPLQTRRYSITT